MSLHTDVPTRAEVEDLLRVQRPACVSIYLPTTPVTRDAQADRIAFKNSISEAVGELNAEGASGDDVASIQGPLEDLHDDDGFWTYQASSLAVFATPNGVRTFRLPNDLEASTSVGDRFYVKPLLRAITFPQAAFVLALAQGSVRLLGISADADPQEVAVPGMPTDATSADAKAALGDRRPRGAIHGSEGQKLRMRQYARKIDSSLRSVLAGLHLPLILAATQPLDGIYRSVNTYPHLAAEGLRGNPETISDADLAAEARGVLDGLYAAELVELRELFETRTSQGRGVTDVGDVARAATFGAVDTVIVDIEEHLPGMIDPETGVVAIGDGEAGEYGLLDEIARRVLLAGGRVVAVRGDEVPGGRSVAAILRYAV